MYNRRIIILSSLVIISLITACPSPNINGETINIKPSDKISSLSNGKPINRPLNAARPSIEPNSITDIQPVYSSQPSSYSTSVPNYSTAPAASTAPSASASSGNNAVGYATLWGEITDYKGNKINNVTVSAEALDSNITWRVENIISNDGNYIFRNAPVGSKIKVTVTSNGIKKSQTIFLQANESGDPNQNKVNFSGTYALDYRPLEGFIYDANDNLITNDVDVIAESTDFFNPWSTKVFFKDGLYKLEQIPLNVKNLRITIKAKGKEISRNYTYNDYIFTNYLNFGGKNPDDKNFAIKKFKVKDLASGINLFKDTSEEKESTFSVDVDTASYTLMRNSINNVNSIPSQESVRIEDYINYFDYNYPKPEKGFGINTEIVKSPFTKDTSKKLLRIGLQGKEIKIENRKDARITLVIDSSGSMIDNDKLETIKSSIKIFLKQLTPKDKISIVKYNYEAELLLDNVDISKENEILDVINKLEGDGGTNIGAGLKKGAEVAQKNYLRGAINRVILCSDGANNNGEDSPELILNNIKKQSEISGISFSSIGVGFYEYNDNFLEQVAINGDGYYGYIDNVKEAVKIFVENATDTLQMIAKDAKVQVKFNPQVVKKYRLIGYENNMLSYSDFRNNYVNAGEIGPNHSVTALYEIETNSNNSTDKLADVIMRYKDVSLNESIVEITKPIFVKDIELNFNEASYSFRLASIVALYGEILRGSYWSLDYKFEDVISELNSLEEIKKDVKVTELKDLVTKAIKIRQQL